MTRITVDAASQSKLLNLDRQLGICNESGQTLGCFFTASQYEELMQEWAKLKFPEDELERRWNEPGERTTAEVLARLAQT